MTDHLPLWHRRPVATNERQITMDVADYFSDLEAHEGCCTWLYCDDRGNATTGIGNLVPDADACAALPWLGNDDPRDAYTRVLNAFGPTKPAASVYLGISDLRLSLDFVANLVGQRLETEFLPGIQRLCPGFDGFPLSARRALVDMAYNLGVHGLAKFPVMLAACNSGDWATAAKQCHRATCRDTRNAWTAQMFVDASVASNS